MSKVTFNKCDICGSISKKMKRVYGNGKVCDLCNKCYKSIEALEDLKNIYHKSIDEINNIIDEKLEVMRDERKEDII